MNNTKDIERRLSQVEQRLNWLDEHGTRGVDGLRAQVTNQTTDIVEINGRLDKIEVKLDSAARVRSNQYIAYIISLLPIYVLLFMSLFHVTPA